jgi:hypothetical protein
MGIGPSGVVCLWPVPFRPGQRKTGGRVAGEPNRATRELKTVLQAVFRQVFSDPAFQADLVRKLKAFELEPRVLTVLLAYAYGAAPRQIDLHHEGRITLAQLVCGSALHLVEDDEDDEPADDRDEPLVS